MEKQVRKELKKRKSHGSKTKSRVQYLQGERIPPGITQLQFVRK
jgi:hypothetical protein